MVEGSPLHPSYEAVSQGTMIPSMGYCHGFCMPPEAHPLALQKYSARTVFTSEYRMYPQL